MSYVTAIADQVIGFAGWLPYRPYEFELSKDKLAFKRAIQARDLLTPEAWATAAEATRDFVLKRSMGSFGMQIAGPFRLDQRAGAEAGPARDGHGVLYAEQFIEGLILKCWFWGTRPFFAHVQSFPTVAGDGERALSELFTAKFAPAAGPSAGSRAEAVMRACAAYQQINPDRVLAEGETAWIDFRYGHSQPVTRSTPHSDNAMPRLTPFTQSQLADAGAAMGRSLQQQLAAPVAFALDGMMDAEGRVWWLEMNSNPSIPPDAYAEMFKDLFA